MTGQSRKAALSLCTVTLSGNPAENSGTSSPDLDTDRGVRGEER